MFLFCGWITFRSLWWKKNALVVARVSGSCPLVISTRWSIYFLLFGILHWRADSYAIFRFLADSQSEDIFDGAIREVKEETGVINKICSNFLVNYCHYHKLIILNYEIPLQIHRLTRSSWKWLLSGNFCLILWEIHLVNFYVWIWFWNMFWQYLCRLIWKTCPPCGFWDVGFALCVHA